MLVFYYSIGTQLERTWGTYRYNLYLFLGMIFTIAGSIILFLYCLLIGAQPLALGTETIYSLSNGIHVYFGSFSTYYINMSIFLAYAATFPEMQVLLMFIIPIKVKWLGIVYGAMLVFECLTGGMVTWFVIGSSLLNFVVFFLTSRNHIHMSPKQMKRRHDFKKQTHAPPGSPNINVRSAAGPKRMIPRWNSVSVPNAMEIMNTVSIICIPMSISSRLMKQAGIKTGKVFNRKSLK